MNNKVILTGIVFIAFFLAGIVFFLRKPSKLPVSNTKNMIKISSPAFSHQEMIPEKYTCQGDDISPPLAIENVPYGAKSLVLIVDDPDAPWGTFTHWLVWNIPATTKEISEGKLPPEAIQGTNDFGKTVYGGPCPPSGIHRYYFRIFALDTNLFLSQGASRNQLEKAIAGHILDQGELMGRFGR